MITTDVVEKKFED